MNTDILIGDIVSENGVKGIVTYRYNTSATVYFPTVKVEKLVSLSSLVFVDFSSARKYFGDKFR